MSNNKEIMRNNKKWAKRLFWFLFWHRALAEYVYETGGGRNPKEGKFQQVLYTTSGISPLDFLDGIFIWDYTEKGEKFWKELNRKWTEKWAKYDIRDKSRSKQNIKEEP